MSESKDYFDRVFTPESTVEPFRLDDSGDDANADTFGLAFARRGLYIKHFDGRTRVLDEDTQIATPQSLIFRWANGLKVRMRFSDVTLSDDVVNGVGQGVHEFTVQSIKLRQARDGLRMACVTRDMLKQVLGQEQGHRMEQMLQDIGFMIDNFERQITALPEDIARTTDYLKQMGCVLVGDVGSNPPFNAVLGEPYIPSNVQIPIVDNTTVITVAGEQYRVVADYFAGARRGYGERTQLPYGGALILRGDAVSSKKICP